MTDAERIVRDRWPNAFYSAFKEEPRDFTLHAGTGGHDDYMVIGRGDTEEEMWEDAANRLAEKH